LKRHASGAFAMRFALDRTLLLVLLAMCVSLCLLRTGAEAAPPAPTKGAAGDEFTYSLFDGRSLQGWTIENDCTAGVEDGLLVLQSGNCWLRSDHTYRDFALHVEWKALKDADYDAGVYIRTQRGGKDFPKDSYQINLLQGEEGNIKKLKGA